MKRALIALSAVLGAALLLLSGAVLYFAAVTYGVELDPAKLSLETACVRLYDENGDPFGTSAGKRDVPFGALPAHLPRAFVAVEDKRFFSHHGFDVRRIGKAILKNISSLSFREGASTISQQLVKNTHLSGEKTIARKLKEFKLTRALEQRYSKEEILALYLNSIYFGHNAFGVARAARFYFGKDAERLTPAESAMLAALVKSPNRYSPFKNAEKCLGRRNFVLSLMREQSFLTEEEYRAAVAEPLPLSPAGEEDANAYAGLVFEELGELFPDFGSERYGELSVYTFLSPDLQRAAEETRTDTDHCALVLDVETHALRALSCSLASPPKRLPASTLKPLLVYAPAVERDLISPATPVLDEKTDFGGYSPSDYGGVCGGYMSARYALAHSVNIPAVKILNSLGVDRGCAYLEKMGLSIPKDDRSLALALGGMKEGFTLQQLADGYAALASGGAYAPSSAISRVEDGRGRVLYSFRPAEKRVFSEETSWLVSDMLRTAATEGTAKVMKNLPYPVAAKTGTGGGADGGNADAYTIAYTGDSVAAVWMGNRDCSPVQTTGGGAPARETKRLLEAIYSSAPPAPFPACGGVERILLDREEYEVNHRMLLADPASPAATTLPELFKRSAVPTAKCERFSRPTIPKPTITVRNCTVCIVLCHAEYYDYEVKRDGDGKTVTVYSGKYREKIFDNSVRAGVEYRYTVTPIYCGIRGEKTELPAVRIPRKNALPEEWWSE